MPETQVFGEIETALSAPALVAAFASHGIQAEAAAFTVQLIVEGQRVEFELLDGGFILNRNNDGPAWKAGLQRVSDALTRLGQKHGFEVVDGDVSVKRLAHGWSPVDRGEDAE